MTDLFRLPAYEALIAGLPGTSLADQWESRVAKVGGKVFSLMHGEGDRGRIVMKVTEESFEILTALDGITQAPYFARRMWVSISASSPLSAEEIAHYVSRSHALVAAGLTKKLRLELGIAL